MIGWDGGAVAWHPAHLSPTLRWGELTLTSLPVYSVAWKNLLSCQRQLGLRALLNEPMPMARRHIHDAKAR